MRWFFRLIGWFLIVLLFTPAVIIWLALSSQPLVVNELKLSHQDIARARMLLQENDPRRLPPGFRHQLQMTEADLNLALNYLLQRLSGAGGSLELSYNRVDLRTTLTLPRLPKRQFINIRSELDVRDGELLLERLQIGDVTVPAAVRDFTLRRVLPLFEENPQYQLLQQMLQNARFEIQTGELHLTYVWDPSFLASVQSTFFTRLDQQAVESYYQRLIALQHGGLNRYGSLIDLLEPLFKLAQERSEKGDPVAENTALLSVLGAWALGQDLRQLVPEARQRPQGFRLKLERRVDFAQHFLGSAALAAQGDSLLADAVVTYKEVDDTDHGSGFSFTDLAADRAGIRFGEMATRSGESARKLQTTVAAGIVETDIIPPARDLPEYLHGAEFKRRFGAVGSDSYNLMLEEIESRVDGCRLYRL